MSCILSIFIIKPQLCCLTYSNDLRCILSIFIIKPQLNLSNTVANNGCILSIFIIKPQRTQCGPLLGRVVSYLSSSSNHNIFRVLLAFDIVVSYLSSSSNHNMAQIVHCDAVLYLIYLHHQTTTAC